MTDKRPIVNLADSGRPLKSRSIVVDGVLFDIGIPVIKWDDRGGFSFYDENVAVSRHEDRKTGKEKTTKISGKRYKSRPNVIEDIDQFFIHHTGGDGDGAARVFNTLHNERGLSVHFVIDDDGRIWQFGDVVDLAFHAGKHNRQSIGVECNLFPLVDKNPDYYSPSRRKKSGNLPHTIGTDTIHGKRYRVFEFTDEQTENLARLAAGCWVSLGLLGLWSSFPGDHCFSEPFDAAPRFPRKNGRISRTVAKDPRGHTGLIGHLQATKRKIDPAGFAWEYFEQRTGEIFAEMVEQLGV